MGPLTWISLDTQIGLLIQVKDAHTMCQHRDELNLQETQMSMLTWIKDTGASTALCRCG